MTRWSWNPIEDDWHETYEELLGFIDTHGHGRPNRLDPQESELAQWIGVQRSSYKDKKISAERVELLEKVPGWLWSAWNDDLKSELWNRSFDAVAKYSERTGNIRIAMSHREDGIAIAAWISTQRQSHKSGELSEEQIRRLESLAGWSWMVHKDSWETKYALAVQFAKREGHANIPQRHLEDGTNIGSWVNT